MPIDFSQLSDEELLAIAEAPDAPPPTGLMPQSAANPYIESLRGAGTPPAVAPPSELGSASREFGRSVLPALAGIGTGALAGAGGGSLGGPPGALIGAILGGLSGAFGTRYAQDSIADAVAPESFMGTQSATQDYQTNPLSSVLGGVVAGGRPSINNLTTAGKSILTAEGRALAAQGIKAMGQRGAVAPPGAIRAAESIIDVPVGAGINAGMTMAQGGSIEEVLRDGGLGALFSKSWIPGMSMNPASRITPEVAQNPVPAPDPRFGGDSRELVVQAPYADVELVRDYPQLPGSPSIDFPVQPDITALFRPPLMLADQSPRLSLPASEPLQIADPRSGQALLPERGTAMDPMDQVRTERAAEIQGQINRLTARRDALKAKGETVAAKHIDAQLKQRKAALKTIDSTVYVSDQSPPARTIEERFAPSYRAPESLRAEEAPAGPVASAEVIPLDQSPAIQAEPTASLPDGQLSLRSDGTPQELAQNASKVVDNAPTSGTTSRMTRDTTKPEQMTPSEFGILDIGPTQYAPSNERKRFGPLGFKSPSATPDAVARLKAEQKNYRKYQQSAKAQTELSNKLWYAAEQAAKTHQPINAETFEWRFKVKRPDGYARDGDMYVYRPDAANEEIHSTAIKSSDGTIYQGSPFDQDWTGKVAYEQRGEDRYSHASVVAKNPKLLEGDFVPGFLTKSGKFLTRSEAFDTAVKAGQIEPRDDVRQLFSEDFLHDMNPKMRAAAKTKPLAQDSPEATKLRSALAKVDEDIALAKDDGDEYGVRGLELAKRKLQDQLAETTAPKAPQSDAPAVAAQAPKSMAERIRSKKLKIDKGKLHMVIFPGLDEVTAKTVYNGALEVAALAVDAGDKIGKAVNKAIQHLRSKHPTVKFDEAEVRKALESDTITASEEIKSGRQQEAAQDSATKMDADPDTFMADADGDPLKTYLDESANRTAERWDDLKNGTTFRKAVQTVKDANRRFFKGVAASLDSMAKGGTATGKKSPSLEKLNREVFGTRPGADSVGGEGVYADMITRSRAKMEDLGRIFDHIRGDYEKLDAAGREGMVANMVKWMQAGNYQQKLKNQPKIVQAIDEMKKLFRGLLKDGQDAGLPLGDAGEDYFTRVPNADSVKRNYDEFVAKFTDYYQQQAVQDGKPIDAATAKAQATAYADSIVLGEFGFKQDGSDLNLMAKNGGNPDFMKKRSFTGEVSKRIDREMGPKFFERDPFVAAAQQIRSLERKIAMAKAFGKVSAGPDGKPVLDPTARWNEFTEAAMKEGNAGLVAEARNLYQAAFGLGNNFDTKTQSFVNMVRNLGYYSYLAYTGISSLTEPTVISQRLDQPVRGVFKAYGETFRAIARQIKRTPPNELEKLASMMGAAERYGMELAMTMGSVNEMGFRDSKNLAKYFYLTGNSLVSNGTSIAALKMGALGIRAKLISAIGGNRIDGVWLEEAGIKKADFDKLDSWLEKQQGGEEGLFQALQGNDPEATTIRKALSKVIREARLSPDASTKNKASGTPFGSLFFSLQSYLYDFADKVLGRGIRRASTGIKGKASYGGQEIDLTAGERASMVAPLALGLPMLLAANFGVGLIREVITPDPERIRRNKDKTAGEINWNRLNRALSRTNVLGPYDILFNAIAQARYERDVAASSVGPYLGGALELLKSATGITGDKNSPNTNTAERKLIRDFVNVGPRPLANLFWSSMPISNPYIKGLAAGGIFSTSQPAVREGAVLLGAGPPNVKKPKAATPSP